MIPSLAIFLVCYFFIATEKIDKTITALIGASLMIAFHLISYESALAKIDLNVIFLLIGWIPSGFGYMTLDTAENGQAVTGNISAVNFFPPSGCPLTPFYGRLGVEDLYPHISGENVVWQRGIYGGFRGSPPRTVGRHS